MGVGGTGGYARLSWQPAASRLGLGFDQAIPEGVFEMYRHEDQTWAIVSGPTRPILIPGRALLWRRAGVANMPELASWIPRTSRDPPPIFDIPNPRSIPENTDECPQTAPSSPRIQSSHLGEIFSPVLKPPSPPALSLIPEGDFVEHCNAYHRFICTRTTSAGPSPLKRELKTLVTTRPQYDGGIKN